MKPPGHLLGPALLSPLASARIDLRVGDGLVEWRGWCTSWGDASRQLGVTCSHFTRNVQHTSHAFPCHKKADPEVCSQLPPPPSLPSSSPHIHTHTPSLTTHPPNAMAPHLPTRCSLSQHRPPYTAIQHTNHVLLAACLFPHAACFPHAGDMLHAALHACSTPNVHSMRTDHHRPSPPGTDLHSFMQSTASLK